MKLAAWPGAGNSEPILKFDNVCDENVIHVHERMYQGVLLHVALVIIIFSRVARGEMSHFFSFQPGSPRLSMHGKS